MVDQHFERTDAYVSQLIRKKARDLCNVTGFTESDFDDVQQDLWLHLWAKRHLYDPSRASFETFSNRVVTNKARSLIRDRNRHKRTVEREACSINDIVQIGPDEYGPRAETIPSRDGDITHFDEQHDIVQLLRGLDGQDEAVVLRLLTGQSQSQIARHMGISRRQVAKAVERIRQRARAFDLDEYL